MQPRKPGVVPAEPVTGRQTLFIVMPYSNRAKPGQPPRWRAETPTSFPTPERALRHAEKSVGRGGIVGSVVGKQTADAEAGEYSDPEIIGRFGETPEAAD